MKKLRLSTPVGNKICHSNCKVKNEDFLKMRPYFYDSGTSSLSVAISAAREINKGIIEPEIIIPAYACPDLISASEAAGVKPCLVDLSPDSFEYNLDSLKHSISANTIGLVAINFLGLKNDVSKLRGILPDNAVLIEDSAQGFPSDFSQTYWQGDLIVCSFGRGKPVSLLGGGALINSSPKLDPILNSLEKSALKPTGLEAFVYKLKISAHNYLLSSFLYFWLVKIPQLKIGETKFKTLSSIEGIPEYILNNLWENLILYQKRKQRIDEYQNALMAIDNPILVNLVSPEYYDGSYPLLRYPLLIKDSCLRDRIYDELIKNGIGASLMYKQPLPKVSGVDESKYIEKFGVENSQCFASSLITLPTHERVTTKEIENTVRILKHYL